ncbi:hypothetical protein ACWEQC_46585 [Streptomyces shenzhenensis]
MDKRSELIDRSFRRRADFARIVAFARQVFSASTLEIFNLDCAHNNSVTKSDPDGLRPDGPAGGASYNDDRWAADRGMTAGYTKKNGKWVWQQTPLKETASRQKYAA